MDFWIDDLDAIRTAERLDEAKRKRKQYSRTCNACKKDFVSGNQLFKHLREKPFHQCEFHTIHYTIKCKVHPEFKEDRWKSIRSSSSYPWVSK
jgi:hypothetical protein